ncbi:permease [Cellvibrio zantedeschiae]|uniref:Permease n=1 Tax=Cellvibrio zantedeschiae TaxID=1237077 RepID=A0ABQ3B2H4_9GAMM|nr:DMT family transporter [Cellvibrio zantedeschiae]GGY74444.1 permease [Cellvibrio zantedeschiae]
MKSEHMENYTKGIICILLGTCCFAAKGILIKLAYRYGVTATPLLMLRMLFSLPFYAGVAIWLQTQQQSALSKTEVWQIIGLGLLSYYVSSLFDFMGLQYISAGLERLILYVYPTLVLLILAFIKHQKISAKEKLALAIAYTGMLLVFVHDIKLGNSWEVTTLGSGLVLLSTISFAIFIVLAGDMIPRVGSLRFTAYGMLSACAGVIAHNLAIEGVDSIQQPLPVYALAFALAIFCTVIPSFLMNEGIRIIGSGRAAILGIFGPVVTLFLGALVLSESLSFIQLAGAALVIGGVILTSRKK